DQNSHHARRPNHSGGMKLDKLHVDQFCARFVGQDNTVAGGFPTVARYFIGATNSSCCEHDRFRAKNFKATAFAIVTKCADRSVTILQDRQDRVLHMDVDTLMNPVILQRTNHFQTGAISNVRESRISMAAKISLQNPSAW